MTRIGILALVMAALLGACSSGSDGAIGSASASVSGPPTATAIASAHDEPFPAEVAGMPVVSVAAAEELPRSGKLDGQAIAVAGYYDRFTPSCPYPGRYIGPLEGWCRFVAFTDDPATATLCVSEGSDGTSCRLPTGTHLAPFFVSETSGNVWPMAGGETDRPVALVVIGHAGDARQWQCTAATQAECASAFVVDRVAWADGQEVLPAAPETGDLLSGKPIKPRMTLEQVADAIGLGEGLLTGAAFSKGDIATIDPRWNLAGDDTVWLVRSLHQADGSGRGETRPEIVWLVDDATGHVIDSHPLKVAADYQPARLWPVATIHGVDCCAGNVFPFYRVESGDGAVLHEGLVSGSASGDGAGTTYGNGYGSGLLDLPAGDYSITEWLATYDDVETGRPHDECSTNVTLRPLDDVVLRADFATGKACTFQPATSRSAGP